MSQKSILSFFKNAGASAKEETKSKRVVVKGSPVKKVRNKRKVQCLESDDESSDQINKNVNGDLNDNIKVSKSGIIKTSDSTSRNKHKEEDGIKENGTHSMEKPSKLMKTENGAEKISSLSPEKDSEISNLKEDSTKPSTSTVVTDDSSNKTGDTKDTLNQNDIVDFIPKRKTARKQINSAKYRRDDQKVVQVKSEPKISENDSASDASKANGSDISPVKCSNDELSDQDKLENIEKDSDKKSSRNTKKSVNLKSKVSSNDPDKVNGCDSSTVTSSNEEMPDQDKVENVGKNSKNKVSPKNTKKSAKSKATSKEKNSPVKKPIKKESIHSFFAPLKTNKNKDDKIKDENKNKDEDENKDENKNKDEDKSKDENKNKDEEEKTKRSHEENEDSPVKKTKKQKKSQRIESDDEDEDIAESDSSVLVETNKTNDSASSKTEDSITASKDSGESEPKVSPKKTDAETSESGGGKQKLTVKSTSVSNAYDPSKNNYHPIEDACWKHGEKVPYLALARTLELIENTSGRLKTIEILSNFLRSVIVLSPDDLLQSVYLCLNRIAPEYCGIELGVGETLLMKAVAQATGRTVEKIKAEVAIKGDLGLVSESSRGNQRVMFAPPKLTVASVFQKFYEIAKMTGNASMAKKTDKIKVLFVACRDCEAKYIIRSLSGKLRIGLAEQSILSAIARAAVLTPPGQTYPPEKIDASKGMSSDSFKEFLDSQILILKTAYCECPNYDLIIPVILKEGISVLPERCQLSPGVPLKPMLAHPTAGIDKVLERFDKNAFTCEFKYDGERAQIHMTEKGDVKIFSRNQEDNTSKYPDVISRLQNALNETTKSFILDSEAVAWDKETKQILPFQVLSTRKRKDAVESEITVQVCIMAFDLLYLNGESLVKKPLKDRRSLLHSSFKEVENEFMFAQYKDGNSAETMQEFLDESVKGNCEGLMVKALEVDASYEIAKRSHNWLKLKKDYLQGIGDTLDLVVIGGYYGKGKRTGNYGGFLLACYDEDNEEFQSICKLGTGFKDDNLEAHTKFLKQHIIKEPKSYFRYDHSLEPDEWFEPVQVWEIKCADLSISPVHKAAMGIIDPEKGISLRFPRFIRIRDDKTPENATNSVQIADMYQKQQQIQNTANKNAKVEEDYY